MSKGNIPENIMQKCIKCGNSEFLLEEVKTGKTMTFQKFKLAIYQCPCGSKIFQYIGKVPWGKGSVSDFVYYPYGE